VSFSGDTVADSSDRDTVCLPPRIRDLWAMAAETVRHIGRLGAGFALHVPTRRRPSKKPEKKKILLNYSFIYLLPMTTFAFTILSLHFIEPFVHN